MLQKFCVLLRWNTMKKKCTQRLPPDKDSHQLRSKRVNYQSYIYLSYSKPDPPPSPLAHGWQVIDGKCIPIQHSKPQMPDDLFVKPCESEDEVYTSDDSESSDTNFSSEYSSDEKGT